MGKREGGGRKREEGKREGERGKERKEDDIVSTVAYQYVIQGINRGSLVLLRVNAWDTKDERGRLQWEKCSTKTTLS